MVEARNGEGSTSASDQHGSGLISLDQAGELALQHARDNMRFYGRRLSRMPLNWQVVRQEETEHSYNVRLSYRPARHSRGEPGMEQFTITRTGEIQSRQILQQPTGMGGTISQVARVELVVFGLLIVAVIVVGVLVAI